MKKINIKENEASEFERFLLKHDHTPKVIVEHLNNLRYFDNWTTAQGIIDKSMINTRTLDEYIKFMQDAELQVGTINNRLNTLRKFYDNLKQIGMVTKNPAHRIIVGGKEDKVTQNEFSEKEMIQMYYDYENYLDSKPYTFHVLKDKADQIKRRDKVFLGLMIFQGLDTGNLKRLCVSDVMLRAGEIYIASAKRSNSRTLKLDSSQILTLSEYLQDMPEGQDRLFSINVNRNLNDISHVLRGINPRFVNGRHLRASVIINWIKKYKKRMTQYMIGYKYVSSTERFESQDTTELAEMLDRMHLFG